MAKTDRELLELAAKAAGIEVTAIVADGIPHRFGGGYWNPLEDDGDALRLAVTLRLGISITPFRIVDVVTFEGTLVSIREEYADDPSAATRRAIVRAAAEIATHQEQPK